MDSYRPTPHLLFIMPSFIVKGKKLKNNNLERGDKGLAGQTRLTIYPQSEAGLLRFLSSATVHHHSI